MRLLIIGSLDGHITQAAKIALDKGAKVTHATTIPEGLAALRQGAGVDMVMVDVRQDVGALIGALEAERITVPVVACGISSDARAAVAAIRAGAKEYVPLPPNPDLIAAVLAAVTAEDHTMIARDPVMARVLKLADQIAPSEASVLITGESGSGKEVMARHLHARSRRADKAFVAVNCAAIPENLLESELFGHEKGAFTGAVARRIGKFEEADGGTLLLDEISEMDLRLQAKLLRAIQEREIDRVGGSKPVKVNIRLLATSNRDLEQYVRDGHFREDLFFRLNVVTLNLPPLRERPGDVVHLAQHFARKFADLNGLPERPLAEEALDRLRGHVWRGNVRELENTMHRAVLLAIDDEITAEQIILTGEDPARAQELSIASRSAAVTAKASRSEPVAEPRDDASSGLVGRTVADVEQDLILNTLKHTLGNRTHAANILGISIRTLRNKLRLYADQGLDVPQPGDGDRIAGGGAALPA